MTIRQRAISIGGTIVLAVLAAIVVTFDLLARGPQWVADRVATLGLRTSDYVIHELGMCQVCNIMAHLNDQANKAAQQQAKTPAPNATQAPQAQTPAQPKTTVVVQQKDSRKFVN